MIKNIYNKQNCRYYHEYYCDSCLKKIIDQSNYGPYGCGTVKMIFRNEKAIENNIFDLCKECYNKYDTQK